MSYTLGIDLGATRIKMLAVSELGEIIREDMLNTSDDGSAHWAQSLRDAAYRWRDELQDTPRNIGLCAPGLASRNARCIAWMPGRMQRLEGLDWTTFLGLGPDVRVLNDGHAALLGEVWRGAAKGAKPAVMLTLGTGVGGAILCHGRLLRGTIGRAGHIGHVSLDPDGANDITGTPGSLEDAIGNCTLAQRSGGRFTDTAALLDAVVHGDKEARMLWDRSLLALGAALVSIINAVDPEVIILGGGITDAGDRLFSPIESYLDQHEWRPGGHRVRIVHAALGGMAGALGAAWYGLNHGELT
jgi:glucokinase